LQAAKAESESLNLMKAFLLWSLFVFILIDTFGGRLKRDSQVTNRLWTVLGTSRNCVEDVGRWWLMLKVVGRCWKMVGGAWIGFG